MIEERRIVVKRNSGISGGHLLATTLAIGLFLIATSQAQTDIAIFTGKFTLTNQVEWGNTVLQPGDYTITIGSKGGSTRALVRDDKGRALGIFVNPIDSGKTTDRNALLIKAQGGQLHVYCLELASLGRALVYDPVLARQAVLEARAPQTVPVMSAKR